MKFHTKPKTNRYNNTMQSSNNHPNTIIICATSRLARGLQDSHLQNKIVDGYTTPWQTPIILTLKQWLNSFINEALLCGEIDPYSLPQISLNAVSEKFLWVKAIENTLKKDYADQSEKTLDFTSLFDINNLVQSAIEANQLLIEWQLDEKFLNCNSMTEESRQFLRWRHEFQRLCSHHHVLEPSRTLLLQIKALNKTLLSLPKHIIFAGFDRFTPLEQQMLSHLKAHQVTIELQRTQIDNFEPKLALIQCQDLYDECRAAVAWAKLKLQQNPQAQLAIMSPNLGDIRNQLTDLLDDTFHPETLHPSLFEAPRNYDFSLGLPLSNYPIVNCAISLLRLAIPYAKHKQTDCSKVLTDVYWNSCSELDACDQFNAYLLRKLGRTVTLGQLIKQTISALSNGIPIAALTYKLTNLQNLASAWPKKQGSSAWASTFFTLIDSVNWAKSRELSSHEYQSKHAWLRVLNEFSNLNTLLGDMTAKSALHHLVQLANNTIFQPESTGETHIQLLGLLETVAVKLDAVWILGMNDQNWPPPAKPNPLLPSYLQRQQGVPNACTQAQTDFAKLIHQRILNSTPDVTFSYALKDGDKELRASTLLADIPLSTVNGSVSTLAEILAQSSVSMDKLNDYMAPAVSESEKLRGGSALLKAQAICPAWAFYQYRLGATKLKVPVDGIDSLTRGNLVHVALQNFWQQCLDLNSLKKLINTATLGQSISHAVDTSIQHCLGTSFKTFAPQLLNLEKNRLCQLLQSWLQHETERAPFNVQACEQEVLLNIADINIKVTIDRIDALDDGSLVVIDYKTSSKVNTTSWSDNRISEPQLPIYAAIALHNEQIAAVCFARVLLKKCEFVGLATENDILPNINGFNQLKSDSAFKKFNNWNALLTHWHTSLSELSLEVKSGVATVQFEDEKDLMYCEVKPLLRLPERQLQFEQLQILDGAI